VDECVKLDDSKYMCHYAQSLHWCIRESELRCK